MRDASAVGSSGAGGELLSLLERFDRAWRGETPPRIGEFLPSVPSAAESSAEAIRRDRLEELVKIDIEYRWRRARDGSTDSSPTGPRQPCSEDDPLPMRPLLEDYLAHHRELGPPERLPSALIAEEYRVRHRWGDRPGRAEYAGRFAALGEALDATLAAVDAELAADSARITPATAPDEVSGSTGRQIPLLCCPHCLAPIVHDPAARSETVTCPACGGTVAMEKPEPDAQPPFARMGRYVLGELLGMGGFGTVWRARDPALGREVAVKLPRGGVIVSRAQEERFLREARSVSRLRHRGIVAVHDAGRDHGTVYIVSELVHGPSLAQWLERGRLGFHEAAELAGEVADALDYIHRNGVVHRDLKPSNILLEGDRTDGDGPSRTAETGPPAVTERPPFHPRIMDFGLAKHDTGEATMTIDGQILGTMAYMSPEQFHFPHRVDGRGDIYSLGVVLYQMLTHELPFRGVARMLQVQVLEDEPAPPRRLNDRVPRDLETVALTCLEKEPARRYASAGELAGDLRRFLAGEPVRARPVRPAERFRRWCRRNPVVASLAAGLVLALLAGFAGVTWQWLRAESNVRAARLERDRAEGNLTLARQIVEEMYTRFAEQLGKDHQLPDYQRQLLEKADAFYAKTALPQSSDPRLRLAAGQASARVGYIRAELGEVDKAEAAYRRTLELLGSLAGEHPDVPDYVRSLAVLHGWRATFYTLTNRLDLAEAALLAGVAPSERLAAEHPEEPRFRSDLVDQYNNLALFYLAGGQPGRAVTVHRKNVALCEALAAANPQDNDARFALARGLLNLAEASRSAGRSQDAKLAYRQAAGQFDALTEGHAGAPRDDRVLSVIYDNLGCSQLEIGQWSPVVASLRRACAHSEAALSTRPEDVVDRFQTSVIHENLGTVYLRAGRRAEAEPHFRRALVLQEKLAADLPGLSVYRAQRAKCETGLGALLVDSGRPVEAGPMLERAKQTFESLVREDPKVLEHRESLPTVLASMGRLYRRTGRTAEAVRAYRQAREALDALPHLTPDGLYILAGVRAQCAVLPDDPPAARAVGGRPAAHHAALDGAMDTMRRAVAAGFDGLAQLRRDTDLDPLRSRADFQALEAGLMDAAFPAHPFSP